MFIVSRGYYSLTYLFSYLLIRDGVLEAMALALEAKSLALALRVVAVTPNTIIYKTP